MMKKIYRPSDSAKSVKASVESTKSAVYDEYKVAVNNMLEVAKNVRVAYPKEREILDYCDELEYYMLEIAHIMREINAAE